MARKQEIQDRVSEGLEGEVDIPKLTPALQPGDLRSPTLVRYLGAESKNSRHYERDQMLHTFELGADYGRARFALWGAVQLDMKLRSVQRGAIVLLAYTGKTQMGKRAQHNWSIRPFRGSTAQLQALAAEYAEGSREAAAAIQTVESRGATAENLGLDDDLPF